LEGKRGNNNFSFYGYLRGYNLDMVSPAIEDKLKRSDCTVDDLLDEDEIIQEMRNQNNKLTTLYKFLII
jgi:hypothetical protein